MKKAKITVPGELPDLNMAIKKAKQHWGSYSSMKKNATEAVAWIAKQLPSFNKINLNVTFYCKNRRKDKDNIIHGIKYINDGLVKAGVIDNDGWKHVGELRFNCKVDKKNPRVEIELEEAG